MESPNPDIRKTRTPDYPESNDIRVTKVVSILAAVFYLIYTRINGTPFSWSWAVKMSEIFNEGIAKPKLAAITDMWCISLGLAIVLFILSIVFTSIDPEKIDLQRIGAIYEIAGNEIALISTLIFFLLFRYECSMETTLGKTSGFLFTMFWFVLVLVFKVIVFPRANSRKSPAYLIPLLAISLAFIVSTAFFTIRCREKAGFENFRDDYARIDELFEQDGCNTLSGAVSIDDTLYCTISVPYDKSIPGSGRSLVKIEKNGNMEILDDSYIGRWNVTNYEDTIFYEKYIESRFAIASINIHTGQKEEFSAADVSSDLQYLFLNRSSFLIGVRGEYLYFDLKSEEANDGKGDYEIWRVKVSENGIDKSSLEKYAWNCRGGRQQGVAYKNLYIVAPGVSWVYQNLSFRDGSTSVSVYEREYKAEDLKAENPELEDLDHYRYYFFEVTSGDVNRHEPYGKLRYALCVNVYNGSVYYALIKGDELLIYKTATDFSATSLIGRYEVDPEAIYGAYDYKLVVSDSYLIFFHDYEYKIFDI